MSVTALDPTTALVVVDLQKGFVTLPTAHPMETIVRHAGTLADSFRRHGLPVVLVNVAGRPPGRTERATDLGALPADWTDLVPELNRGDGDHLVTKRTAGAFTNTGLAEHLRTRGVTHVVVAGVATSMGVESTARQAHELGFNVTLAVDAVTDTNLDAHTNSVTRIFPRIGETGTTADIIALLGERARRGGER